MIGIETLVWLILGLLVAAAVIGLLYYAIGYMQSEWGGPEIVYKAIRTILVIGTIVVVIFVLLGLVSGRPLVRWGPP